MTTSSVSLIRTRPQSLLNPLAIGTIAGWILLSMPLTAMALVTSPSSLVFTGAQGGANPTAQTLTIWKRGDRTKSWTVRAGSAWASATPSSGTISTERDQISVSVDTTGLPAGTHSTTLTIVTEGLSGRLNKTSIPIALTISGSTAAPTLKISPIALNFSAVSGGANPAAQLLSLTNPTGGTLSWTMSDNAAWLTLSTAFGTTSTETDSVTAAVNIAGLAPGTYTASVAIAAPGATNSPQTVPVSLVVSPQTTATPIIGLSTSSLAFSGTAGGANPANQTVTVSNAGAGTLTWTASDNAAWLTLTPASGTNTGTVTASVNLTGLAAGTYTGTITVAATGATSKTLPVALTVSTATVQAPIIGLSTSSLAFSGTAGGANPANQTVTVSNAGAGTLAWTASDNAAWLTLTPASGTNTGTVTASVNLTGLAAGTYTGTITVAATGATSKTLPVSLTVASATTTTSSATLTWGANTESDLAEYKVYMGTQPGTYGAPIAVGKVTSYQITNLTKGTTYYFSVTAVDTAGNESLHSAEVSKSIF